MEFKEILKEMLEIYLKKNHDYGNSFDKSLNEWGEVAGVIRMEDKFNRIKTLLKTEGQVNDESINDTLLDLANYTVMTLLWRRNKG